MILREESDRAENKWCPLSCEACGSDDVACYAALRQDCAEDPTPGASAASAAGSPEQGVQYSYAMQPVMDHLNREYSYVWDITSSAPSPYRLYHIEEEPGAIDWRNAVEVPTEEYYDALRQDMGKRHPKASPYVLDHILSLEAMLDIAILSGFSFGSGSKANLVAEKGELLGDWVGRQGRWPSGDRIQAIRDFPVIYERQQLQQFLGCTNWVRWYMTDRYPRLVKMIGKFLKPDVPLPADGLGGGNTVEDKVIKAIKRCAEYYIQIAVLDEAAAMDGTRPLENLADCSGIAWGGSSYQMNDDLTTFNCLLYTSPSPRDPKTSRMPSSA